jgi:hypothetical protein
MRRIGHILNGAVGTLGLAWLVSLAPVVNTPLKWFETFFHELSHGLAAWLTGGSMVRLVLEINGAGLMVTAGGWRLGVAFAGYAGVFLWGSAIYLAGSLAGSRAALRTAGTLAAVAVLAALRLGSLGDPVTLGLCLVIAASFGLVFFKATTGVAGFALRFIGMYVAVSGFSAPTWLLMAPVGANDAATLRQLTGLPEFLWVVAWLGFGGFVILSLIRFEARRRPL